MSNPEEENSSCGNLTAVDAISERLSDVTRLAEKLDEKLYKAGTKIKEAPKGPEKGPIDVGNSAAFIEEPLQQKNKTEGKIDTDDNAFVIDMEAGESYAEEYVTATDCTTTPMARSRSESFVTMSECEDGLTALAADRCSSRQEAALELRGKQEISDCGSPVLRNFAEPEKEKEIVLGNLKIAERKENLSDPEQDKLIVSRNLEMTESKQNGAIDPEIERTTATSIIEKVEEKSGKIVKEVTETTTLRVSHDTRFGVASYNVTSNTVREGHEHADLAGILDANAFGVKTNGLGTGHDELSPKDDFSKYNREELSLSDVDSIPCKLENGHQAKFTKMIRESSQREARGSEIFNETSNETKLMSLGLECRRNDDSGIEMTPRKNGDVLHQNDDLEDLELLRQMKTVSRSQVVVESSTITSLRTIH